MKKNDEEYFLKYKLDLDLDRLIIAERRRHMLNAWSVVIGLAILLGTVVLLFLSA